MTIHHHHQDKNNQALELHDPSQRHHQNKNSLVIVLTLTITFFFVELFGGLWTKSLALLSDAGHMLSDIAALGLALFALWFSHKPAHAKKTFGYYRAEVLTAFLNGGALVILAIIIFHEAYERIQAPVTVKSIPLLMIASAGLIINLIGAYILSRRGKENINIRGAFIHVLGDALGSLGAISAGLVIWLKGWMWFDPLVSFFIGGIIIYSAWRLLWDTFQILMQGVPAHINLEEIKKSMVHIEGVKSICDLHVWTLTSHVEMLSAHVVVENVLQSMEILKKLQKTLQERYGIEHVTIQIEDDSIGTCNYFV
ncbi:MAG TPA: cation diffusion facilitator family transporter [Thermodesulfobacteriota bacterium]|nr:cation diffusion facilitator family transporter [Thermodesulfobacteriota bacterium]